MQRVRALVVEFRSSDVYEFPPLVLMNMLRAVPSRGVAGWTQKGFRVQGSVLNGSSSGQENGTCNWDLDYLGAYRVYIKDFCMTLITCYLNFGKASITVPSGDAGFFVSTIGG